MLKFINFVKFVSILVMSFLLFSCATTQYAQIVKEGQVIDMGHYTVALPPGKWVIQKQGEILMLMKAHVWPFNGQVQGTTLIKVFSNETAPQIWHLSEEEVADNFRNNEEKIMNEEGVGKGLYEIADLEKEIETVDGKKLYSMSYKIWKDRSFMGGRKIDSVLYLYFPPDFRIRHNFYGFLISTDFVIGSILRGDLTEVSPVIKSFQITSPTLAFPAGINGDLLKAVHEDNVARIKDLISQGADVNAKDQDGVTPLMVISAIGNKEIASRMIDRGAKINEKDQGGRTPLLFGAHWDQSEIVTLLIEKGADINAQMDDGRSPLIDAVDRKCTATANVLIIKGANVNLKSNKEWTALMAAALRGNIEILKILVEKGADVNAKSENDMTALKIAKSNGQVEVVRLLKEAGAKE